MLEDRSPALDRLFAVGAGIPETIPDDLLLQLVLPTPPESVIRQRVDNLIAPFLAAPRPDLADPVILANTLIREYSQGKTQQEIARALLADVDGVRSSARRVARTWGIHVAQQSQWEAHESLGADLVIGYQVFSALSPYSRSWHKSRHQVIYYRKPKPGQKGFFQLPHPPQEPADPAERPLGAPALAWNCL